MRRALLFIIPAIPAERDINGTLSEKRARSESTSLGEPCAVMPEVQGRTSGIPSEPAQGHDAHRPDTPIPIRRPMRRRDSIGAASPRVRRRRRKRRRPVCSSPRARPPRRTEDAESLCCSGNAAACAAQSFFIDFTDQDRRNGRPFQRAGGRSQACSTPAAGQGHGV